MAYIGPGPAWAAIHAVGGDWDEVVMTAIAGAESGWNTTAISYTNDYGLLQINLDVWPELFKLGDWRNAVDNAAMGYRVWKRQGYRAWVTYWQGSYRQHLDAARAAAGSSAAVPAGPDTSPAQVGYGDWAGWDFSERITMTAAAFKYPSGFLWGAADTLDYALKNWT